MSELTKKRRTKSGLAKIHVAYRKSNLAYEVEESGVDSLFEMLEKFGKRVDEKNVPASQVFADLDKKYGKGGAILRGLRERENMNQEELARLSDVTQGDLSKMERGERPIGKDVAKRLAKALNADYRVFL